MWIRQVIEKCNPHAAGAVTRTLPPRRTRRGARLRCAILAGCAALGLLASGAACSGSKSARKKQVVCTIGMVTDVVREVAGGRIPVTGIIGEGVDPHLYKPTRNDIAAMQAADLVFYSGLLLEGKMTDTLIRLARDKPVTAVTERIDEQYLIQPPDMGGHFDPHVWMDVSAWSRTVDVIRAELTALEPEFAAEFSANATRYQSELAALDAYVKRVIGTIPPERRVLITAHDAFNYFGRAYGLEVLGIQGLSTESEAGLEDINRLVDLIVERKITAVFVETSVADRNVRALLEGARARGHTVTIGGTLFSDAMGAPGTYEGTYIGMIDHNATVIARALGGDAPERGMNGKLRSAP